MSDTGPTPERASTLYAGLRRAIIEQALMPGTKLPEDAIGESFGVSRTLVRSALTRLAAEGLVELRHNRGAVVASLSLSEARDVFDIRRNLEALVVQRLADRLTREQQDALRRHVARVAGDAKKAGTLMDEHLGAVQERALIEPAAEPERSLRSILSAYGRNGD